MKKSKFAIVIALGLVLCLLCGVTTTFSWFRRENPPREESGDTLKWSGQYKISNGQNISIKTVESNDDGTTFGENAVTDFSGSIQAGKRRYFCTEISNAGDTEQSVSLFMKNLKASDSASASGLYVGVNKPLKTYKSYSNLTNAGSSGVKTTLDKYRMYCETNNVLSWKDSTTVIRIRYGTGSVSTPSWQGAVAMTYVKGTGNRILCGDIPTSATVIQVYANNDPTGANATPYILLSNCKDLSTKVAYDVKILPDVDNLNNHKYELWPITENANFINYYSIANIPLGTTFNAGLVAGTDYIGNSISYSSSSNSVFTVDSNGIITPVATGTAKLRTTIVGKNYGDSYTIETTVNVYSSVSIDAVDAPIVTNLEIKPKTLDGPMVSKVYWYIKNESSSTITYTLDDVYISL